MATWLTRKAGLFGYLVPRPSHPRVLARSLWAAYASRRGGKNTQVNTEGSVSVAQISGCCPWSQLSWTAKHICGIWTSHL